MPIYMLNNERIAKEYKTARVVEGKIDLQKTDNQSIQKEAWKVNKRDTKKGKEKAISKIVIKHKYTGNYSKHKEIN